MASRVQRRAGTKSTAIPGSEGENGKFQKFRLGRYKRPKGLRFTKSNQTLWKAR